jgi:hypothetical protein
MPFVSHFLAIRERDLPMWVAFMIVYKNLVLHTAKQKHTSQLLEISKLENIKVRVNKGKMNHACIIVIITMIYF